MDEWMRKKYDESDADALIKELFAYEQREHLLTERRNIVEHELADLEYRYNQLKLERDDARFFAEDATKELREFKEYLKQRFPNGVVNA